MREREQWALLVLVSLATSCAGDGAVDPALTAPAGYPIASDALLETEAWTVVGAQSGSGFGQALASGDVNE